MPKVLPSHLNFFFQKNTEKATAEREIIAKFAFALYSNRFMNGELRVIISGGGTGGHIFPAVSIANAIREKRPDAKILFVGAEGRMEMQRVPAAGYEIKGLPVAGFNRKQLWKNISVLIKLYKSRKLAKKILKDFHPWASIWMCPCAASANIPTGSATPCCSIRMSAAMSPRTSPGIRSRAR